MREQMGEAEQEADSERERALTVAELMLPTLKRVCMTVLGLAFLWLFLVVAAHHPYPYWPGLAAPSALVLAAAMSLLWAQHYRFAAALTALGLCAATVAEITVGDFLFGQWLAMATVVVTGLLLGPLGASAAAAAIFSDAALLHLTPAQQLLIAGQAAFPALLVWVVGGGIHRALKRAEESENRAWSHAAEAMRRRGELRATSKVLKDMYALLERTNRELELARREAEEAREIKARFAANISHELRTPLNLITGFSRIMYRSPEVYGEVKWTPALRADIRKIYNASQHLPRHLKTSFMSSGNP